LVCDLSAYDQQDAAGFIKLNALRLRTNATVVPGIFMPKK
jgi:hypothetical protein